MNFDSSDLLMSANCETTDAVASPASFSQSMDVEVTVSCSTAEDADANKANVRGSCPASFSQNHEEDMDLGSESPSLPCSLEMSSQESTSTVTAKVTEVKELVGGAKVDVKDLSGFGADELSQQHAYDTNVNEQSTAAGGNDSGSSHRGTTDPMELVSLHIQTEGAVSSTTEMNKVKLETDDSKLVDDVRTFTDKGKDVQSAGDSSADNKLLEHHDADNVEHQSETSACDVSSGNEKRQGLVHEPASNAFEHVAANDVADHSRLPENSETSSIRDSSPKTMLTCAASVPENSAESKSSDQSADVAAAAEVTSARSKSNDEDSNDVDISKQQDNKNSVKRTRVLLKTAAASPADKSHEAQEDHEQLAWENEPLCGFTFNEKGELRDRKGNAFVFAVTWDQRRNQERYNRLGEAITNEVYRMLEEHCQLKRIYLPLGVELEDDRKAVDEHMDKTNDGKSDAAGIECSASDQQQRCDSSTASVAAPKELDHSEAPSGEAPTSQAPNSQAPSGEAPSIVVPRIPPNKPHSFVFVSENWKTADRLLVLIHGSGVVRAGQWARRLIINDDVEKGTQIPYIKRALDEGYGVVVLNTNLNTWPDVSDAPTVYIPENESPEAHACYVWRELIVKQASAQHIAIVAHSYGGMVVRHLVSEELEECKKRIFAVAFTDSVHGFGYSFLKPDERLQEVQDFFAKRTRNWVTSDLPLDEPMPSFQQTPDSVRLSAGHTKHEWTSHSSFGSVFRFFDEQYRRRQGGVDDQRLPTPAAGNKPDDDKVPSSSL